VIHNFKYTKNDNLIFILLKFIIKIIITVLKLFIYIHFEQKKLRLFFLKNINKFNKLNNSEFFKTLFKVLVINVLFVYLFNNINTYIKISDSIFFPFYITIFFLTFLYLRSSLPRYKLVDLHNKYWKYVIIYTVVILIIYVL
jgi:NADH:ubiquinone oxidoreductase subunit H